MQLFEQQLFEQRRGRGPLNVIAMAWLAGLAAFSWTPAPIVAEPVTAVSASTTGTGNGLSAKLSWDLNGRFAVFVSEAQNLVPGQNTSGHPGIFLFDRLGPSLRLVSHVPGNASLGGNLGVDGAKSPSLSADGKWVVYTSPSTNLVPNQVDTNNANDVFLWNRETDTTVLVSHSAASTTTAGDFESKTPASATVLSAEGRFLVYTSLATNLVVAQQSNTLFQIFTFDRVSGATFLVSHSSSLASRATNGISTFSVGHDGRVISADGRFVVFQTAGTDLVAGVTDTNNTDTDIYLWDRSALPGTELRLLSRRPDLPLTTGNSTSTQAVISADGSAIAFSSRSFNLEGVDNDSNTEFDVFYYDRLADTLALVSHAAHSATATGNGGAANPSISGDGGRVAFASAATNHVFLQVDNNAATDIFFWAGSAVGLMSHLPGLPREAGNGNCGKPIIALDGSGVVFNCNSSDLVAGVTDTNAAFDTFFRPRNRAEVFLVSHLPNGTATGNGSSSVSSVAVGGALIGFESAAENLVAGDNNGQQDVFFHGSLIMADSFESGDFSAWSQHLP